MTLIGFAGSGKSTLVKYLITQCYYEKYKIPVKVELRYLNEFEGTLKKYITDEIFKFNRIGFDDSIIESMFESGNFLFFFDGYDEINSSKKQEVTKEIDSFVNAHNKNIYVITSRPNTNVEMFSSFSNYRVCDLEENEISEFIKKQFPDSEIELAEKIISAVSKKENLSYKSFLSNPLLLSMFILTFQTSSAIPQKRSEFYSQVFNALFSMHDSMSKMAYVREKQSGLPKDKLEGLLQVFSYISFFEQEYIFSPQYMNKKLSEIKEKKPSYVFDNEKLIDDLQVAVGIINKEGLDYTFPHRSLQEYFSACYISNLGHENKKKIYDKLMLKIHRDPEEILVNAHFYNLLEELDFKNFHKNLTIPLISKVHLSTQQLKTKRSVNNKIAFFIHQKMFIIYHFLLKNTKVRSDFTRSLEVKSILMLDEEKFDNLMNEKSSIIDKLLHQIEEKKSLVMLLKNEGHLLIMDIEMQIDEIDRSDSEIIDIVSLI